MCQVEAIVVSIFPGYRKAVVGFIVAAIVSFAARNGSNLNVEVTDAIMTLVDAAFVGFTVWLIPNKKTGE